MNTVTQMYMARNRLYSTFCVGQITKYSSLMGFEVLIN